MTNLENHKRNPERKAPERSLIASFWLPLIANLIDVAAVTCASMLAYYLRFHWPIVDLYAPRWQIVDLPYYFFFGLTLGLVYVLIAWSYGGYNVRIRVPLEQEVGRIMRGSLLAMGLVMAGIFFYRDFSYSRMVFLLALIFMIPALIVARSLFQRVQIFFFKRGVGVQRVALWGAGDIAVKLWQDLAAGKARGFDLIGAVGNAPVSGGASLGTVENLKAIVYEHDLDSLVMAPPPREEDKMNEVMHAAEGVTLELLYCPAAMDVSRSQVRVTDVGGRPILKLKTLTMSGVPYVVKRILDFGFSALFLICFSWLYGLIALAVFLDSGKPLFYKQPRVGLDGREFDLVKFRTMRVDAEQTSGPVWAVKSDPRTTRVGKFLRRWSLDEIPQFWSVLRGDMSLVGPRPERPHFVNEFSQKVPQYLDRHRVKAGLTGWAQVHGFRGSESTVEERTECDLFYVENWSLWLDVRILFRTVVEVIRGRGAM
jgi:exopolysaccharide biosynthesis polyprenyl glycosylphosphotransferase